MRRGTRVAIALVAIGVLAASSSSSSSAVIRKNTYGAALVRAAQLDIGKGEEPPGSNLGPYVAELGERFGLVPPFNYCAAAVAKWLELAARISGEAQPIEGSANSKETARQLERAGLWVPIVDLLGELARGNLPGPGALLVFDRSVAGDESTNARGHIGVLELAHVADDGASVGTIEANHGPTVERVLRSWRDPRLLGVGLLGGWA